MAEFIREGDMVEAFKCEIYARKIIWKGIHKDPITNKNMTLYELDRNCSTEISEEIGLEQNDLQIRKDMNVHLCLNDKIKGKAIKLYVNSKRNDLKQEVKEGQSATHGASLAHTTVRTIGSIKYPFDIYKKLLGYSSDSQSLKIK